MLNFQVFTRMLRTPDSHALLTLVFRLYTTTCTHYPIIPGSDRPWNNLIVGYTFGGEMNNCFCTNIATMCSLVRKHEAAQNPSA